MIRGAPTATLAGIAVSCRIHPATVMNTALTTASTPSRTAAPRPASPRLDLYTGIHKAMRSFMAETLVRLGRIDVADEADRDQALDQLEQLLGFCAEHLRHENTFVHTAIEARHPAGSAKVADEHTEHSESIAALREEAAALRSAPEYTAGALALRLYRHLALFVAENLQHMHIEETVHNALLWQHYGDAELAELHGRLMASLAPAEKELAARWMLPASTPAERSAMIGGMKAELPPEALLGLMAMLRPHLDAPGWAKLAGAAGVSEAVGG
jgi:iron-sulfur cluster repair protein YtfE (RIC family)